MKGILFIFNAYTYKSSSITGLKVTYFHSCIMKNVMIVT